MLRKDFKIRIRRFLLSINPMKRKTTTMTTNDPSYKNYFSIYNLSIYLYLILSVLYVSIVFQNPLKTNYCTTQLWRYRTE